MSDLSNRQSNIANVDISDDESVVITAHTPLSQLLGEYFFSHINAIYI